MTSVSFNKNRQTEAGNMLLIVLIGIALFAALVFAITRNNRFDAGASENAALQAQQITSYADKINSAVQNVMLQNHCLSAQLSFANSTVSGYTNGGNTSCQIFDQTGAGGGVVFQAPPAPAVDTAAAAAAGSALAGNYLFEGNICVTNAGTACAAGGTTLVFIMPWVTQAVCAQINWITMKSTTIPAVAAATFDGTKFAGSFAGTYTLTTGGTTMPSGCYQSTASPPGTGYQFYEVLLAN